MFWTEDSKSSRPEDFSCFSSSSSLAESSASPIQGSKNVSVSIIRVESSWSEFNIARKHIETSKIFPARTQSSQFPLFRNLCLPSACLNTLHVENAACAGLIACFREGWMKLVLGRFATGRRADREEAIDREKVRGTVRARVRMESILNRGCQDEMEKRL